MGFKNRGKTFKINCLPLQTLPKNTDVYIYFLKKIARF